MEIIAHRGASGYAPENTMEAFKKARDMGVKTIELDVQLTADGQVVVIHDYLVDRTTNGSGLVGEKSYKEVAELDAGSWFGQAFKGAKIPLLAEVLKAFPELRVNIELKSLAFMPVPLVEKAVEVVVEHKAMERVFFSSFNHGYIRELNEMGIKACGLLIGSRMIKAWEYIDNGKLICQSINPSLDSVDLEFVKECQEQGYQVIPYTVNDRKLAELFQSIGIDGIFTNYPDILNR